MIAARYSGGQRTWAICTCMSSVGLTYAQLVMLYDLFHYMRAIRLACHLRQGRSTERAGRSFFQSRCHTTLRVVLQYHMILQTQRG